MPELDLLRTPEEVGAAIQRDPRLGSWEVSLAVPGIVDLVCEAGRVLIAWSEVWSDPETLGKLTSGHGERLILVGEDAEFEAVAELLEEAPCVLAPIPLSPVRLSHAIKLQRAALEAAFREIELERSQHESDLLISVGRSLSQERDIDSLLDSILLKARQITGADAGSVYIVEDLHFDVEDRTIRFMVSQNDTVQLPSEGFTVPVSEDSIVGACLLGKEAVNIADLYDLDDPGTGNNPWGFVHDRSFDETTGYQTRSMVTVPMISAREEVIGLIQLINRLEAGAGGLSEPSDFETHIIPFEEPAIQFANALASQAGIALETALLYDEVQTLFEGFVRASVTAIESRDPTTSGHSERVADLTLGLAKAADRSDESRWSDLVFTPDEFREIEYAALLHDFGKVGVRERVLVKAKKLYPFELEAVLGRFAYLRKAFEAECNERKVRAMLDLPRQKAQVIVDRAELNRVARLKDLDEYLAFILECNEPTVMEQSGFGRIADIARKSYIDHTGTVKPYLSDREVSALQVPRGSLTSDERAEIEQHVVHTYNFLKRIPWSRNLREIPEIAVSHHEKLDGTGYPFALGAEAIPVPTRMMTIADIYDALTASDRPYKKAMPSAKALDILSYEVKDGHVDAELYQLFLDSKVYEKIGGA